MNWPPPDAEGRPAAVPAARSVTLKTPPECRKVTITGEGRRILPLHVGEGPAVPTPLRTRSWACRRSLAARWQSSSAEVRQFAREPRLGTVASWKGVRVQMPVLILGTITALAVSMSATAEPIVRPALAAQTIAPVLRGRALEIVDDQGRVRAEIKVLPAQPTAKMPDGTTEDGSGLVLGGEKGYTQLLSRRTDPFIKIVTKDGREHTIKP
jgi:hypothetical protein